MALIKSKTSFSFIRKHVLGLSQQEVAQILKINPRTIRYYERGRAINKSVANEFLELSNTVCSMIETTKQLIGDKKPEQIILLSYANQSDFEKYKAEDARILKSVAIHNHILANVCAHAISIGISSDIVVFKPKDYFKNLKGKDDEVARGEYAAEQASK